MTDRLVMTKWQLEQSELVRRRAGKTAEEACELGSVAARIQIQGIDDIDPSTSKTNRQRLIEETADVLAQCEINMATIFSPIERAQIRARKAAKVQQTIEWEALYGAD